MKKLALLLCLVVLSAYADTRVDNMVAQCEQVMAQGVCSVSLGSTPYVTIARGPTSPGGRFSTSTYSLVGFEKNPSGKYEMCQRVLDTCTANFDGDGCRVARAMFRQTAP